MKHYEVNFVDGTMKTVAADDLPPQILNPLYIVQPKETAPGIREVSVVPEHRWWYVTILRLLDNEKFASSGKIHINLDTVTFIKEV